MCKVAVIGYGVVGSGTVELFMKTVNLSQKGRQGM